ncbi:MAG: type VI secretion system tube protein Hcp [Acidobacteria bacterium]|jgi:type VI secretion system secreted protein Hcp|nr:MAG: type VI secretion system tube protein Hcp [Acidobacteriota bacterium]
MAFDCFLKLDPIKGDSQDQNHKNEIDVLSFSLGFTQTGTGAYSTGSGGGKVSASDFSFVHRVDSAHPLLMQNCCTGEHIDKAVLTLRKAGGPSALEYLVYTFEDVMVSSVQPGGSSAGDDVPLESVSLNYAKVSVDYQPQADTGSGSGTVHGGYDLKQNVTV